MGRIGKPMGTRGRQGTKWCGGKKGKRVSWIAGTDWNDDADTHDSWDWNESEQIEWIPGNPLENYENRRPRRIPGFVSSCSSYYVIDTSKPCSTFRDSKWLSDGRIQVHKSLQLSESAMVQDSTCQWMSRSFLGLSFLALVAAISFWIILPFRSRPP